MKKSFLSYKYFIPFIILLCCITLTACKKSSSVTVTIAGKEIPMKGSLQTCIDNGLITISNQGEPQTLKTTLRGREVNFDPVRIGNSDAPCKTPVYVNCFNVEETERSVYDCSILRIHYDVYADNADQAPVLINGVDFWGMTEDEALDALKALKLKVDYTQMHESHSNTIEDGKITWTIESSQGSYFSGDSENPQKTVKEFDDETYYISSIDISIINSLHITLK